MRNVIYRMIAWGGMDLLSAAGIGLTVGFISGLLGVGGGFIIVPLLIFLGVAIHSAIATSLLAVTVITTSASITHRRYGNVRTKAVFLIVLTSVLTAQVGPYVALSLDRELMQMIFGAFLVLLGAKLIIDLFRHGMSDTAPRIENKFRSTNPHVSKRTESAYLLLLGLISGFLSSFLGIGGGVIIVPFLSMVLHYDFRASIGTSTAVIAPTALSGTLRYALTGHVMFTIGLIVGIAGALTSVLGAKSTSKVKIPILGLIFSLFLIAMGLKLLDVLSFIGL